MNGPPDPLFTVHHGDARNLEPLLDRAALSVAPDRKSAPLSVTITSPPYGPLINYGVAEQIGHGQRNADYLNDCRAIFDVLYRYTRPDGCMWLVADSFMPPKSQSHAARAAARPSSMRVLPFELAALAGEAGWILREVVIWHKDKARPWSHHGRFRNTFEYVLLMVKTENFKFYASRLRDSREIAHWWVRYPERYNPQGKIPDNVWHIPIPTQGSWAGTSIEHACPFPPDLVRRLVLLSSDPGDVICDPFSGSGTVAAVSEALGRRPLGTELNSEYVDGYKDKVRPDILSRMSSDSSGSNVGGPTAETIVQLRAVKFAKALFAAVRASSPELQVPRFAAALIDHIDIEGSSKTLASCTYLYVVDGSTSEARDELLATMKSAAQRAPLTKYGIANDIMVVDSADAERLLRGRSLYLYEHGKTWITTGEVDVTAALAVCVSALRGKYPPIVATVSLTINADHVGDPASESARRRT